MPEIARFFGIIIRMFAEEGQPHHRAHFHAYYQDHAAVFAVDTSVAVCPRHSNGSWRLGRRFTERNCSTIGISCNRGSRRSRSNHSGSP